MFPLVEIHSYLSDILRLQKVGQLLNNPNKLEFLTTVLRAHSQIQPFQNITMVTKSYDNRHRPSWEEIKSAMFRKEGGVCYNHHYIFFEMLKTLGFNVSVVRAMSSQVYNHVIILIKNLMTDGDLYLLECGCGYPTFRPINLNFEKESPIFMDSFLEYKYIKHNGAIMRMHRKGDKGGVVFKVENEIFIDGWRVYYQKDEFKDMNLLDDFMEEVLTNPNLTPFHASLRWIRFTNFQAQIMVNRKVLIENKHHVLERKDFKNHEELIQQMAEMAPDFEGHLREALKNLPLF